MKKFPSHRAKGFFIRLIVAVCIFVVILLSLISDSVWGNTVRTGVEYLLTKNYDLSGYLAKISQRMPDLQILGHQPDIEVEVSTQGKLTDLPVSGKLIRGFGWQQEENDWPVFVPGIELSVDKGAVVRTVLPGKVVSVDTDSVLGRIVVIEHDKDCATLYGMLGEIGVKPSQDVAQGQVIGTAAGTIFHFQLREGDRLVDPLTRLQQ